MSTISHMLKRLEKKSTNRTSNRVITSSPRHNKTDNGMIHPIQSDNSTRLCSGHKKTYAILPACMPIDIFKVGKRTDDVFLARREFQGDTYTILSHGKLGVRELRVFVALVSMLMDRYHANLGDEEPYLHGVRISDIKRISAVKSNYSDLKESIQLLEDTFFSIDSEEGSGSLISVCSEDGFSTMTVSFHWLIIDALKSCFNLDSELFTPFTIIYIDEQYALAGGRYSEIGLLMHAYFSQSISQGKVSTPYLLTTLARKMFDIEPGEVTRNHIKAIKGGLNRLNEIGWTVSYRTRSLFTVSRPKRKKASSLH